MTTHVKKDKHSPFHHKITNLERAEREGTQEKQQTKKILSHLS